MRAINHAMTGALIGLTVTPVVALPISLLSHFALDAVPHYDTKEAVRLGSKTFQTTLIIDAALCLTLVLLLFIVQPQHWFNAICCAFLATLPDFMWLPMYVRSIQSKTVANKNHTQWLLKFHDKIQWFARPSGIFVEIVWAAASIVLLTNYL